MEHLNTGLVIAEQTEYLLQKFSFWKGFKKGGEEGAFPCLKKKKKFLLGVMLPTMALKVLKHRSSEG